MYRFMSRRLTRSHCMTQLGSAALWRRRDTGTADSNLFKLRLGFKSLLKVEERAHLGLCPSVYSTSKVPLELTCAVAIFVLLNYPAYMSERVNIAAPCGSTHQTTALRESATSFWRVLSTNFFVHAHLICIKSTPSSVGLIAQHKTGLWGDKGLD